MREILDRMFELPLPAEEKVARSILVYLFLILMLRIIGRRELAQINPLDLVVLLTLSNTVQNAIIGDDNSVTGGLIGAGVLLLSNYLLTWYLYDHPRIDRVVEGAPIPLISDGRALDENLRRLRITTEELRAVCRHQGVARVEEIETAILETSGTISVFQRHPTSEEAFAEQVLRRLDVIERLIRGAEPIPQPPPAP